MNDVYPVTSYVQCELRNLNHIKHCFCLHILFDTIQFTISRLNDQCTFDKQLASGINTAVLRGGIRYDHNKRNLLARFYFKKATSVRGFFTDRISKSNLDHATYIYKTSLQ